MLRLALHTTVITSALAATISAGSAHADTCAPARVMVVLDKSSSMQTGSIGSVTKWDIAVQGLGEVLAAYEGFARPSADQ